MAKAVGNENVEHLVCRIPMGFHASAQGCEDGQSGSDRATLDQSAERNANPNPISLMAGRTASAIKCRRTSNPQHRISNCVARREFTWRSGVGSSLLDVFSDL